MKWMKNYQLFKESKTYSNKNLISEICISMVLLNNEFLDNILDRGLKARYSENSEIFLTDLKNLLLAKNRLELGKFVDGKCITDDEVSKINGGFDEIDFDIEKVVFRPAAKTSAKVTPINPCNKSWLEVMDMV
jgi:hypothetical protein